LGKREPKTDKARKKKLKLFEDTVQQHENNTQQNPNSEKIDHPKEFVFLKPKNRKYHEN
jgi:hypothetical protein